ncbi:MAG TPA: RagB/SusD family nutrient uptake outer membrane protein [Puia sp.]|nr:RagB/SusD family nutrient uptake outer membrane protein [Puia sp.]
MSKEYLTVIKVSAKLLVILVFFDGCNKLVTVPLPINRVTSAQTFSSDANATAAMLGIYEQMSLTPSFSSVETTVLAGESADELTDRSPGNMSQDQFLSNTLSPLVNSQVISNELWQPAFFDIFSANSIIEGVQSSSGITAATRTQLIGEAKFIRAFCYFYLTNFFGGLPLVTSTDFNKTAFLPTVSKDSIYQQIISDLIDAQQLMVGDFSFTGGEPIRATKWAATALLARVYLYQQNWLGADSAATALINSGLFRLVGLDTVFKPNNQEAIFQLQSSNTAYPYCTQEGYYFVPLSPGSSLSAWMTPDLLTAFDSSDQRYSAWVECNSFGCYPYKYQMRTGTPNGAENENYNVLRLAEMYLIRAEAENNLGNSMLALSDIDAIRIRAGLDSLSDTLTKPQIFQSIQQENRIEFFAEWGHRWFDLKRWNIALSVLDTIPYKLNIRPAQLLYPIPVNEIQTDPYLKQNPGYQQ